MSNTCARGFNIAIGPEAVQVSDSNCTLGETIGYEDRAKGKESISITFKLSLVVALRTKSLYLSRLYDLY